MKIGTFELLVILLVAFLVLGPDQTLAYTRKIGKALRTLKVYVNSFTEDIRENVSEPLSELTEPLSELGKPLAEIAKPLDDVGKAVQEPLRELDIAVKQSSIKLNSTSSAGSPKAAAPALEELEDAIPIKQ